MPRMGAGRTAEPQPNHRLTVAQAADRLGITEGAVRSRIKRGTLRTSKEGGAVFVLLGGGTPQANQTPNDGEPTDQPGLVEELRDRVAFLERQLERHGDETERLHQIIGGLAQANAEQARTIRAIEAPAAEEPAEDAETVEEEPERAMPRSDAPGPQAATEGAETVEEGAEMAISVLRAELERMREQAVADRERADAERAAALHLEEEMEAERSKGFWARLFGG